MAKMYVKSHLLLNYVKNVPLTAYFKRMNSSGPQKLFYTEYGDPLKVINVVPAEIREPQAEEVLVKLLAAPVNPADINTIQGKYPSKPKLPAVPGNEGVGKIVKVGSNIKDFVEGDHVVPLSPNLGTWQTHLILPKEYILKVPKKLGLVEAATLTVNPCTAFRMLKDFTDLKPGDTVIQNGANSACGQNVIQICRTWGIRTINIVRDRPNIDELKTYLSKLGATHVLTEEELRTTEIFRTGVVEKPKLALNCVGGKNALECLRHLQNGSPMVTYGGMSREPLSIPTSALIFKDLQFRGFWMTRWSKENVTSIDRFEMFSELISMMTSNELHGPASEMVDFQNFKQAILNTLTVKGANISPDVNVELVRHLQDSNEIRTVSLLFASFKTNERRVRFLFELMQERGFLPELSVDDKSSKTSEKYRQEGNEMFKRRKIREAHEFYTKSVAFAETQENKSLAYANRSAVLFEKGLYHECLCDIERALENNYPEALKPKLAARQSKARALLPTQEKVEFFTPVPSIFKADRNPLIQSAASSIKIESSEALGRHIVATRDIEPGEIIAIENSFCHNLIGQEHAHCHYCLKLCYTLIPCPNCTEALFCSEACQADANMAYHQYECPILLTIKHMDLSCRHLHLRVAILARDMYGLLDQCVLNDEDVYRSDRYNEIHNLVANTSKRSVSDIFNRGVHAAALYHLLKMHTKFFEARDEEFEATFMELLLLHMQNGPCNFHAITEMTTSDKSLDGQQISEGAYSFLSMFNHSCSPNVVRYYYGSTAVVITIEQIKKGQQCFDNYGYHYAVMLKADRKAKLKKQYFFDCSCTACTNNYPLFDSLQARGNSEYAIADQDMEMLQKSDLETAKRIFKELAAKITKLQPLKPDKNLNVLQECLKQCCFIFSMIKSPI